MVNIKTHFKAIFYSVWSCLCFVSKIVYNRTKITISAIHKWIGYDGLLNLETCTILVFVLSMILDDVLSAILTMLIAVIKTCYDKYKSHHDGEMHDFICCMIGIIFGLLLVGFRGYFGII